MVPQLTITTEDLLNKDLCKSIMIINRMPTLAFLTMRLQFPTLRDSHLTGDQTESQSLTRINNSNSGPMEMELDQRSKTCSGIWDISQKTQHNSTSGLDTQISTPKTRKMASQVPSMDSTLRGNTDQVTTISCRSLSTVMEVVVRRLMFSGISETLALILIIFILYPNNHGWRVRTKEHLSQERERRLPVSENK